MKWTIILAVLATSVIACEKSPDLKSTTGGVITLYDDESFAKKQITDMPISGTWDLVELYIDNGTGEGTWITPQFSETICFNADRSFLSSRTFPLYGYGYTNYITDNDGTVFFMPSYFHAEGRLDGYRYQLESPTQLLFFPICKENCPRRYQLRQDPGVE